MDDQHCRQFFLQPQAPLQRRYEALRAYFLDERPPAEIADRFGYRLSSLKAMACRFRAACSQGGPPPFFFRMAGDDPPVGAAGRKRTDPSPRRSPMSAS